MLYRGIPCSQQLNGVKEGQGRRLLNNLDTFPCVIYFHITFPAPYVSIYLTVLCLIYLLYLYYNYYPGSLDLILSNTVTCACFDFNN